MLNIGKTAENGKTVLALSGRRNWNKSLKN